MSVQYSSTLNHHLERGQNCFGLIRILAASAVVFSHAWSATNGSTYPEPLQNETGYTLGWHAVNIFFVLSGILITGSLHKNRSVTDFFLGRFLRIYPALILVIMATVYMSYLFVDIEKWDNQTAIEYLFRNIFLIGADAKISGVFENNPEQYLINIPLWTLKYEVFAYLTLAVVTAAIWRLPNFPSLKQITILVIISSGIFMAFFGDMSGYGHLQHLTRLIFAFYLGVACWLWRELVKINIWVVIALAVPNFILLLNEIHFLTIQIIFAGALTLWVGTKQLGWMSDYIDRQDYSYGIYIMGYPIQQSIITFIGILNPWHNFVFTMVLVIPMAAFSWNFVEKPAMQLRKTLNQKIGSFKT